VWRRPFWRRDAIARTRPGEFVDDVLEVVFLAGRLGLDDDGWPLVPLIDRLRHRGIHARVICLDRGVACGHDPRFVEFPALESRWLRTFLLPRLRIDANFENPRLLHAVHVEMAEAVLALAELWRVPHLQTLDDFAALDRGFRFSRRWFRRIIATSSDLADGLVRALGFPADRVSVIRPGLSPPTPSPVSAGWKVPVIGTAGPAVTSSGFAVFLEAARLVLSSGRDAEFLIATQGPDAIDVRRQAQARKIADRVSVADFAAVGPRFWTVLSIYCQPSLTHTVGRTLALALAHGIPSIASSVRGLHTLIDHGRTGTIVPAGDPEALALAINEFLDHGDLATRIGLEGQAAARALFDLETEADCLTSLYRSQID
jgi:glycosyltransferase involved in cell wall biosynthesis